MANYESVLGAYSRIQNYIHKTPVVTSKTLDELCGRNIFLKCENLQKTGSFKPRGALNAILQHKAKSNAGIVTHSSGNHGQAVAWGAKIAGLPCTVVVPKNTPGIKCAAIKSYGACLVFCDPSPTARFETCSKIALEENKHIVPPYDHDDVISGQGTIAVELMEQVKDLDAIFVPVSGGGMTSGIAIAAKAIKPDIKIFVVEPSGKNLKPCLLSKKRLWSNPPQFVDTIAEGIRTQQCGQLTFPILCDLVETDVFTVTDADMIEAMKFSMQYLKLVIEASSGAGIAAVMSQQMKDLDENIKNVGVILCGGNVDIEMLPWSMK